MANIQMYVVDAFSDKIFSGNTCAVCIFSEWPDDSVLQNIAKQNLFAETAFIVAGDDNVPELRWFTVSQEVDFCGYGTVSAGYVYLNFLSRDQKDVVFQTRNYGQLKVENRDGIYQIETSAKKLVSNEFIEDVCKALGGIRPKAMIKSERDDLIVVYSKESDVLSIAPDFNALMACGYYGYILTSLGDSSDYSYRYISPRMPNVWEDPVNGSSQSSLVPYWAEQLNKNELHGRAVSQRGGNIYAEYKRDDSIVIIGGHVSLYAKSQILLP